MSNTFAEQDTVTELRKKLRNTIYQDFRFGEHLKTAISNRIPLFRYSYDYNNSIVNITINKSVCESVPGFMHKKEFYMPLIHDALVSTYYTMLNTYSIDQSTPDNLKIIEDTIYACKNTICSYMMLDVTAILDNTIVLYL